MLQANNLWKSFGPRKVVAGVSFSEGAGEILSLPGPNGACSFWMQRCDSSP